jgi:hypothetical protein
MSLIINNYDSPFSSMKLNGGYGVITEMNLNFLKDDAIIKVSVYTDEASYNAGKNPIETVLISAGTINPDLTQFPRLSQIVNVNRAHFDRILDYLYDALLNQPNLRASQRRPG